MDSDVRDSEIPDERNESAQAAPASGTNHDIDLDAVERDLDDVQAALVRLDQGTYWTDEITGELMSDEHMASHPTARTSAPTS